MKLHVAYYRINNNKEYEIKIYSDNDKFLRYIRIL